jgi:hypothetical protein
LLVIFLVDSSAVLFCLPVPVGSFLVYWVEHVWFFFPLSHLFICALLKFILFLTFWLSFFLICVGFL